VDAYVQPEVEVDEDVLTGQALGERADLDPGWLPPDTGPENLLLTVVVRIIATIMELVLSVSTNIFRWWGQNIIQVPAKDAEFASAEGEVTALDNGTYLLGAGTEFALTDATGAKVGFATVGDVTVDGGDASAVTLRAVIAGEAANDLDGTVEPVTSVSWLSTLVLDAPTEGGVDAEEDEDYLNRLPGEASLLSRTPILPVDFEVMALRVPGIARAAAFDLYDPDTDTDDNEGFMTVALIAEDGGEVSSEAEDEYVALIEETREVGFEVHTIGPTENLIDIEVEGVAYRGFDPPTVRLAVIAAIEGYLDKARWGRPNFGDPSTGGGWINEPVVRRSELDTIINQVVGFNYRTVLEVNGSTNETTALTGKAPVAQADTVTVTVTAP
jgi:hypothetical protein